jgi:para-aminobenzoate synthetase component 1
VPTFIPIIREIAYPSSALDAFSAISSRPGSILLESGTREPRLGRWSFLACDPFLTFRSKGARVEIASGGVVRQEREDPWDILTRLLAEYRVERPSGAPPLIAGAMGYFGYDLGRFVERIPEQTTDDAPMADCHLGFYGSVLTIDHVENRAWVSAIGAPETDPKTAKRLAERRAGEWMERVEGGRLAGCPSEAGVGTPALQRAMAGMRVPALQVRSNFGREEYVRAVARAKEYIAAGDIYQVNLSQRLHAPLATTPFDLYCRLTDTNPAPFAAYFETPDCAVVSCSPERFLQVRGGEVETRPIKGTRPRGATPEEDRGLAAELLASEKDRAENVMIVDLERNDLGRVCEFGSVHVPELFALESYATVHHLVSTVRGKLRPGTTALDCLRASFPGGSITGAPKVRSMEIIEEMEPTRRGVYTGAIGYLCFSGDMDVNIVIRTVVVKNGIAYFQVGGGIVADSDPEGEYQETIDKGQALARALAAEAGAEEMEWPG